MSQILTGVSVKDFPSQPASLADQSMASVVVPSEADSRMNSVRERTLATIRCHMPIAILFNPELQMDLGLFIKNQVLVRRIAELLLTFGQMVPLDRGTIVQRFEGSDCLQEVKDMFKGDASGYLSFLYDACFEVLSDKTFQSLLCEALQGRIFTVKNALIAQKNPQTVVATQAEKGIPQQSFPQITKEGASFLRESLKLHLKDHVTQEKDSFQEQLTSTTRQLIPFVRTVTKLCIRERVNICIDDPITYRNPTGYNFHAVIASTVMEACLQALGFKARMMHRSDLEPTVTLSTVHGIVEVTSPQNRRYVVDPTYTQFHKDVCLGEVSLPSPVLVLEECEVDSYIEKTIMVEVKKNLELVLREDPATIQKLVAQDQDLPFRLMDEHFLPQERNFSGPESWVREAFHKVWGLRTYHPVSANMEFQELFNGLSDALGTLKPYNYIRALGIAPLTQRLSLIDVERNLEQFLVKPEFFGKNHPEAVSLISQLPTVQRSRFAPLLDLDTRINSTTGLGCCLNAYFRSLKKIVNPQGTDRRVVYGCSGADCMSVLLSTDANEITFIDFTRVTYYELAQTLLQLKKDAGASFLETRSRLEQGTPGFFNTQVSYGGSTSSIDRMINLPLKLLFQLHVMGVDLNTVSLKDEGEGILIEFPWQYEGAASSRNRKLLFVSADITKPDNYPELLKRTLSKGIDIFYMKAAFFAPQRYPDFLPQMARMIQVGGWLMTTDKTMAMESTNPETCLQGDGQSFVLQSNEWLKMSEELVRVPVHPFCSIIQLEMNKPSDRFRRAPGSDHSYWSILNLRQKVL
jgi:hypothetical protein